MDKQNFHGLFSRMMKTYRAFCPLKYPDSHARPDKLDKYFFLDEFDHLPSPFFSFSDDSPNHKSCYDVILDSFVLSHSTKTFKLLDYEWYKVCRD